MIEVDNKFVIDTDAKADWAVGAIKESEEERDRLIMLAEAKIEDLRQQIEDIKAKYDRDNAYLYSMLEGYMDGCKVRETITQTSYKLLSGTLVRRKEQRNIIKPEGEKLKALAEWVSEHHPEFIKTAYTESVNWSELKKVLKVEGEVVITADGEVVDVLEVQEVPATFSIK